ncbi:MAG: thiamine pyrophosphate-binding protein [Pseudomonadota bacterium]
MKGGDLLIECLKAQGVRCVFGMPGVQNLQIYDAIFRRGGGAIDHYLVRHEYASTLMAGGFARATGEVGVAVTVPGPGATNAATGILEAFTDCMPVLLITGQSHSRYYDKEPAKMFHGLDQMAFFRPITKYCAIARSHDEIPKVVVEAFRALRSGRPGPVVLEFPDDVLSDSGKADVPPMVGRTPAANPDPNAIRAASEALNQARMPMIFAGSAVIHAGAREELRLLAEKLNAPVAVTRCAKGALREDHPLALSHCNRFLAREAMKIADCTLAVGPRFTSLDTLSWSLEPPRPIIQIDEDPREIGSEYPCDFSVLGDLKATLRAFIENTEQRQNAWKKPLQGFRKKFAAQPPIPLLAEIREVLPEDGILSVDVHAIGYATLDEFPVSDPSAFLFPNVSVSLGYAFPAALGAKAAHPEKPVVCLTGDGGFMMGSPELSTAMKYGMNVVTIVVNDRCLSSIKGSQQKYYDGRIIDADLHNPDFVQFAESFGAYGRRVDNLSDFKAIFQEALSVNRPSLIEVPMVDRQQELIDGIDWLRSEPSLRVR